LLIHLTTTAEIAMPPTPQRQFHLVKLTAKTELIPQNGRAISDRPKRGDFNAFLNFLRPERPEGGSARARKIEELAKKKDV
jgi:hypothetical protein